MDVRKAARRVRARFSRPLPQSMPEFLTLCDDVIELYDLPTNERFVYSIKRALSQMIQQLPPTIYRVPTYYFGCTARKAIANEVMFDFQDALHKAKKAADAAAVLPLKDETQN